MKKSEFRQIIREEIRNLYLAEAASEKDALKLSKMVELNFGNRKFYKTKITKRKYFSYENEKYSTLVTVDIMFKNEDGDKSNVKFMFYSAENYGNGEVLFDDPTGRAPRYFMGIIDWMKSGKVTFDAFKKTAPARLKYWNKQAMKDGVVTPL